MLNSAIRDTSDAAQMKAPSTRAKLGHVQVGRLESYSFRPIRGGAWPVGWNPSQPYLKDRAQRRSGASTSTLIALILEGGVDFDFYG